MDIKIVICDSKVGRLGERQTQLKECGKIVKTALWKAREMKAKKTTITILIDR